MKKQPPFYVIARIATSIGDALLSRGPVMPLLPVPSASNRYIRDFPVARSSAGRVQVDRLEQLIHVDRLSQVQIKSDLHRALAIVFQTVPRQRHQLNPAGVLIRAQ